MSKAMVLVVDDQDSIRHFVGKALEDEGYDVRSTASVREARTAIETAMPDVVLLDLKLPDGTGLELLQEIKRLQPEVVVILMTAFGEVDTAVEAMGGGAFWFVKKPFQNQELLALVARGLESQRLWIELRRLRRQAFSDARTQKPGLMELANHGTLFLDEIGEMSPMLQVKLLRVLERRTFKRVGGTKDINVNVRIISATNQDLERMVQEGGFREDLYYRLKVVPLYVPPLRERREDIVPLARLFMDRFARQFKKSFREIAPGAERILLDYPWPGNIRELRNLFERTMLLETGELLEPRHLKLAPRARAQQDATLGQRVDELLQGAVPAAGIPFEALIEEMERALIVKPSCATKWNQSR